MDHRFQLGRLTLILALFLRTICICVVFYQQKKALPFKVGHLHVFGIHLFHLQTLQTFRLQLH